MRTRRLIVGVACCALSVGLVGALGPPAGAVGVINPVARSAAEAAITARLGDLGARLTLVNQTTWYSSADRQALLSELNQEISGLTALKTTIAAETDQAAFRTEAANIYSQYRVYALVLPQVHLVRAADLVTTTVLPGLQAVQQTLQQEISSEQQQGKNVSATAMPMSDLSAQIAAVQSNISGVSGTLTSITPAQWDANHAILANPRQRLGTAGLSAGHALVDVRAIQADLK